jgi:non-ribosomal peptide synthetase-like protein
VFLSEINSGSEADVPLLPLTFSSSSSNLQAFEDEEGKEDENEKQKSAGFFQPRADLRLFYVDSRHSHFHAANVHNRASSQERGPTEVVGPPRLLHQIFERQAANAPEATALLCAQVRVTYGELDARANRLARFLRTQGIGCGVSVALLLPRSKDLYVALLAVLKAGAAYVPLEPDYPSERVRFILDDSAARLVLTCAALAHKAEGFQGRTVILDDHANEVANQSHAKVELGDTCPAPEDLCYVIYTSGTTGRPKGVQIEHRNVVHLVQTEGQLFKINPDDRVFQGFSIAFDASVEEIWLAFFAGAALVIGTEALVHSGPALSLFLSDAGVTVLSCVPTLLSILEEDVPSLRLLILGGEVCPPELVKRWWKPGRRIVNTYGPTEATVVATCADCYPDKAITIGRPLPGYCAFILNELLELAPEGEPGELALGGLGLARGYLGQQELTNQKFISRSINRGPGQRLYRTGDRARWTQTGELEFLGRLDTQVKIRGFRVELSEIESVLMECPEVKAAAAVLRNDSSGISQLVAYVVPRTAASPDPNVLRTRLKARLPAYMVPAALDFLPALPTLPSGKVDRNALLSLKPKESRREVTEPCTPLERQIVQTWAKLFSSASVSTTDDFFLDLGGHSLLAARMVSELRRFADFDGLSVADVYRYPTAVSLARALENQRLLQPKRPSHAANKQDPTRRVLPGGAAELEPKPSPESETKSESKNRAAPSSEPVQGIPFWRHFFCGAAQLLSLIFVLSFFALQWLAPYLTYTLLVEEEYDFLTSILGAFGSLVLVYPVMLTVAIALKWLIIGRYKPGEYPLWGWYYFRFWLVTAIEGTVPVSYLSGTPLLSVYLRLMGAKVGKNVFIQSDHFAIYDLLTLGDDSSLNADATLLGYSVSNGLLHIGPVTIGRRCFVGTRAFVGENASMADDSALEDLSLLQPGQKIGPGETWVGSPAQLQTTNPGSTPDPAASPATPLRRFVFALLQGIGLLIFPILVVAALFPGIALMNRLNYLDPYYWYLLLSPLVAVSFVMLLCLEIVALKWVLLGRIRSGLHRLDSWYYLRKWFVDKTMELSLDVVGPLYASVYLSPWYTLLGARLGRDAEISTASFISPDLLSIGEESFIADNVSLGAPRVRAGWISIDRNQIGRRAFIGNSAMLPPGTVIGDNVLIGCLSAPPQDRSEALREDSGWLGSPALFLRQRLKTTAFSEETTFEPPARLRVLRAAIEFVRIITPSTSFIILISLLFSALLLLHDQFSLGQTLLFFPVLYFGCGFAATALTIAAKWLLAGRYRPCEKPLWSTFVWRNELINALHEHLAGPFLINSLTGTPFISWYLRLLGARIGRRVYVETIDFSEFDLARIGDEAALNSECTVQTHLFEDRVMKMSRVDIGPGCSVGANSLVLYDTRMEPGANLGPLSLLMKGETLLARTTWAGVPARTGAGTARLRYAPSCGT